MANLLRTIASSRRSISRDATFTLDEWTSFLSFAGTQYPFIRSGTLTNEREEMNANFAGYVQGAYKGSPVVFACMHTRMMHLSEVRFQFRQLQNGRPGDLFGTQELAPLEAPWENGTTGDLIARMSVDADLAGNAYVVRRRDRLYPRRPDWMTIILAAPEDNPASEDPDEASLYAYAYTPGGPGSGEDPIIIEPADVAHFAPIPDPLARYRGMSWIDPVIRDILGDRAATTHKERYFTQGATPNIIVMLDRDVSPPLFKDWVKKMRQATEGPENAGRTMYLGAGATAMLAGNSFRDAAFKEVQAAGETRIAAAAGTPPVIVGLSEGLAAATYSNYGQARRRFGDGTCRPWWRRAAAALGTIITEPPGAHLWYDTRDVAFLREDEKDISDVRESESRQIAALINAGFEPDSVISAVVSGDYARLQGSHTGLTSVQLNPPASANGSASSVPSRENT